MAVIYLFKDEFNIFKTVVSHCDVGLSEVSPNEHASLPLHWACQPPLAPQGCMNSTAQVPLVFLFQACWANLSFVLDLQTAQASTRCQSFHAHSAVGPLEVSGQHL